MRLIALVAVNEKEGITAVEFWRAEKIYLLISWVFELKEDLSFFTRMNKSAMIRVSINSKYIDAIRNEKDPAQNEWESAFRQTVWNFGIL